MHTSPVLSECLPQAVPPDPPAALLNEYEACWGRVRNLASETVREQRTYLNRFIEFNAFDSSEQLIRWLSAPHLLRFVVDYAWTHGPGSQKWMQTSLRSFLQFCQYRDYICEALRDAVPSQRRRALAAIPKSLPDEYIGRLLAGIDRSCALGLRDTAIIILAGTYGVRNIQLRSLRLDAVDWAGEQIHFPGAKGGNALCLPLTVDAGNAVLDYLRNGRPNHVPHPELFLQGRPPFRPFRWSGSFSGIVSRRLRQAGIELPEGVSRGLHSFRHAFASRLTGKVPLKHIADLLGHRDIGSTFIYAKVDFNGLSETALPWPEQEVVG